MGGTSSKTVTEQVNEHVTNISVKAGQQCSVIIDQEQSSMIVNTGTMSGSNITMKQATDVDLSCMMKTGQFADLQRDIANAIVQEAKAKGDGLLSAFGASDADAEAKIHNVIKNNVTIENVNKTMIAIRQEQKLNLINQGTMTNVNIDMSQGAEVFAAAMINQITKTGITETIDNKANQIADAETKNPLSFITDLFGVLLSPITSVMNIGTFFMILIFCVVAYVVYTSIINPKPGPQRPLEGLRPGQTALPGQTTLARPGQTTPGQTTPGQTTLGQATPGQTTPARANIPQLASNVSATSAAGLRNRAATMPLPARLGTPVRLGTAATNALLTPA